jgi:hypothetical protein
VRPTGVTSIDRAIGGFPSGPPLVVEADDARTPLALELAHHAPPAAKRALTPETAPALLRKADLPASHWSPR